MKLCTFIPLDDPSLRQRAGVVEGDEIVELDVPDVVTFLEQDFQSDSLRRVPVGGVRLLAPIPRPPSIRDFFAFEDHVATARANRGSEVPPFWYQEPVFYFTNPSAVIGPEQTFPYPCGTTELDYELEVAAVVGRNQQIVAFTILNDWSARDLQRDECSVGLGPAKGKDFATSLGPWLVTVDEHDGSMGRMTASVNGEIRSEGDLRDLYFSWERMRQRAAMNAFLHPGEVLGSGTVGGGCILEHDDGRWLQPGDVVELAVEGLGVLRNTVGYRRTRPRVDTATDRED